MNVQYNRCCTFSHRDLVSLADSEDGRLMPQNNHLIWVWMPGSFIEQRLRGREETK